MKVNFQSKHRCLISLEISSCFIHYGIPVWWKAAICYIIAKAHGLTAIYWWGETTVLCSVWQPYTLQDEVQQGSSTLMRLPWIHDRHVPNNFSKQQIRIKSVIHMASRQEQLWSIQSKRGQPKASESKCPFSWTFQENIWLYVQTQLFLP